MTFPSGALAQPKQLMSLNLNLICNSADDENAKALAGGLAQLQQLLPSA